MLTLAVAGCLEAQESTPTGSQPATFTLSGKILEKGTKAPVLGGSLYLEAAANTPTADSTVPLSFSAETDLKGNYRLSVPEGTYKLAVAGEGYKKTTIAAWTVKSDARKDFYLEKEGFTLPEVVVTTDKASKTQVSHEVLSKEELTSVPGTMGGDVLRALQALPGILNAGTFNGQLLVRGSGPGDNLYFVDRIPMAFPFHFGIISVLDSNLIKDIDFSTGGYAAPYPGAMGGLVNTEQRDARLDRWGARADVNLLLSEGELEGPITGDSSLELAGRRSYLELFAGALTTFTEVPSFGDYQAKYSYNPSPKEHWDFTAFGSGDQLSLNAPTSVTQQNPILAGQFSFKTVFDSQGINYRNTVDDQNTYWNTLYHSNNSVDFAPGQVLFYDTTWEVFGDWFSWKHDFDKDTQLEAGLQYGHYINGVDAYFFTFRQTGQPLNPTTAAKVSANITDSADGVGVYADQRFKLGPDLDFSLGGRADYSSRDGLAVLSPRFSAAWHLTPDTTVKASYGLYYERPSAQFDLPGVGNPALAPQRDIATIVGVEQQMDEGLRLRVEAFNKDLDQLVVNDPATNYSNAGTGTARGLEVLLRRDLSERFFGWISYTLSDSERQDGPGRPTYLFDYDEPNVVTAVANYKINPGWETGLKWVYSTGHPYTPAILGAALPATYVGPDGSSSTYYNPVYRPVNSQRLPDYARLDFSTSFSQVYDTWQWKIYFDIINVLGAKNVLGYSYNNDYTQRTEATDIPFLPYIGFEAKY